MNHPKDHQKCFARLACVKHAASVHPEPGSNSLKKFVQDQIFAWLNFIPFYLLWFCSLRTKFFWTFKDMSLFSYQGSWFVAVHQQLLYHIMFASVCQELFSTFFEKFLFFRTSFEHLCRSSLRRWLSYHPFHGMSTPFFEIFHIF